MGAAGAVRSPRLHVLRTRRSNEAGFLIVNTGPPDIQLELDNSGGHRAMLTNMAGRTDGAVLPDVICEEEVQKTKPIRVSVPKRSISRVRW